MLVLQLCNMTSVVAEVSIVMVILARVYRYRINSRLRWTEEMVEDCVDNLRQDVKEVIKKVFNEATVNHIEKKRT